MDSHFWGFFPYFTFVIGCTFLGFVSLLKTYPYYINSRIVTATFLNLHLKITSIKIMWIGYCLWSLYSKHLDDYMISDLNDFLLKRSFNEDLWNWIFELWSLYDEYNIILQNKWDMCILQEINASIILNFSVLCFLFDLILAVDNEVFVLYIS